MKAGFENMPFRVATTDGRGVTLLADVYYTARSGQRFCLPAGATSDGASTPREAWPLLPPFGEYWPAAVLHDTAYRNSLRVWDGGAWARAALGKAECDALLLEAMETLGVAAVERETIYEGVVIGGKAAFEADRAAGGEILANRNNGNNEVKS